MMNTKRALGAVAILSLAAGTGWLAACSSNDATGGGNPQDGDASTTADARVAPAPDAGTSGSPDTGTTGTTPAADAGSSCHPPTLHPPTTGVGVYCPYSAVDGGDDITCAVATQQCCETPSDDAGPSTCIAAGTACPVPSSTVWQCEDPADCPTGQVCCAATSLEQDSTCSYFRAAAGFAGTHCAAACPTGELTICEKQSECATGTCTPFRAFGNSVGACH